MRKINCWEYKKCGREPMGNKIKELGICPAATKNNLHGSNNGQNGGRACWVLEGTLCGNQIQGHYVIKLHNCMNCEFYMAVQKEEGANYQTSRVLFQKMKDDSNKLN